MATPPTMNALSCLFTPLYPLAKKSRPLLLHERAGFMRKWGVFFGAKIAKCLCGKE